MRTAHRGKERHVVKLMNLGRRDEAVAYMKTHGMIEAFQGAPEWKPISAPEGEKRPIQSSPDEYHYPEFKPIRDPLPPGVRWARILRELGNELQKVVTFESDDPKPVESRVTALLWMGIREQKDARTRGRLIGQTFPIESNPDTLQGGYRVWRR